MRVCLNCVVRPRASHVVPAMEGGGSTPPQAGAVPTGALRGMGCCVGMEGKGQGGSVRVEKGGVGPGATGLRLNGQPWGYGEAALARKWTVSRTWGEKNTPQNTPKETNPQTNKNNKEKH